MQKLSSRYHERKNTKAAVRQEVEPDKRCVVGQDIGGVPLTIQTGYKMLQKFSLPSSLPLSPFLLFGSETF